MFLNLEAESQMAPNIIDNSADVLVAYVAMGSLETRCYIVYILRYRSQSRSTDS
jgi:hypothetical protein